MPYMAIELMSPSSPVEHRLEHDLESLCLVFLHIARFTCGPIGNPIGELKNSYCISKWHHEHVAEVMKSLKKVDLFELRKKPEAYVSDYWAPIASYITDLLDIIYPGSDFEMKTGTDTCKQFKAVLIAARDHCNILGETPTNYAAFTPTRKRPRTKSSAQDQEERKHKRPLLENHANTHRSAYVPSFAQYSNNIPVASQGPK